MTDEFEKNATNCCIYGLVIRYGPQSVASASGGRLKTADFIYFASFVNCLTDVSNFVSPK